MSLRPEGGLRAGARLTAWIGVVSAPFALGMTASACGGSPRDAVVPSTDIVGAPTASAAKGTPGASAGGVEASYEHVAKRPHGVVALAEARGISPGIAAAGIDRLADRFEACVGVEGARRALQPGAMRLIAPVNDDGSIGEVGVKADTRTGSGIGLLCVVAPLRTMVFPHPAPAPGDRPGLAIEVLWGS